MHRCLYGGTDIWMDNHIAIEENAFSLEYVLQPRLDDDIRILVPALHCVSHDGNGSGIHKLVDMRIHKLVYLGMQAT